MSYTYQKHQLGKEAILGNGDNMQSKTNLDAAINANHSTGICCLIKTHLPMSDQVIVPFSTHRESICSA